jgi:cellulose biosynthesis protein BcsQ
MKITVFSAKGSAGKTPISVNIALDRGYAVGTNETYHVLDSIIPEEQLLAILPNESFPTFPPDIDVVFDLGGAMGGDSAASIRSAVEQSDVVFVPVYNEYKSINGAYHTIMEVQPINPKIVLICTKLEKRRNEIFRDWRDSEDFKGITNTLGKLVGEGFPAIPLKFSRGFDTIFQQEKSLRQIVNTGGLDAYTYRAIADQFDAIYTYLDGGMSDGG